MNDHGMPKDHYEEPREGRSLEDNIKSSATWARLLFMTIFVLIFALGCTVGLAAVVLQFFWVLFTGETNEQLTRFGRQLAAFAREVILFLTFNTELRPFPFDKDWPAA